MSKRTEELYLPVIPEQPDSDTIQQLEEDYVQAVLDVYDEYAYNPSVNIFTQTVLINLHKRIKQVSKESSTQRGHDVYSRLTMGKAREQFLDLRVANAAFVATAIDTGFTIEQAENLDSMTVKIFAAEPDTNDERYGIVAAKIPIGKIITAEKGAVYVTSRQDGIIDLNDRQLSHEEQEAFKVLTIHDSEKNPHMYNEEMFAPFREIVTSTLVRTAREKGNDLVQPVVESVYMTEVIK